MAQAPDIETLFDFETQIDAAIVSLINEYIRPKYQVCAYPLHSDEDLPENRIAVTTTIRGASGPGGQQNTQMFFRSGASLADASGYAGIIELIVVTRRETYRGESKLRGALRAIMSAGVAEDIGLNTRMDYLDIVALSPGETVRGIYEDQGKKLDTCSLSYDFTMMIRPGAWPPAS